MQRDKFMRHGELLLSAALSAAATPAAGASFGGAVGRGEDDTDGVAQALERCLAVVRLAVVMLADMLRPGGPNPDDQPVTALGQHHVTVRQLLAAHMKHPHPLAGSSGASSGRTLPVPAPRVHVQELLSFDPAEGPKPLAVIEPAAAGRAGELQERLAAVARVRVDPRVSAKAKRLGREVSLKVKLVGGGEVVLLRPLLPPNHGGTASTSSHPAAAMSSPPVAGAGSGGDAPVPPSSGGGAGHSGVSVVMPPPAGLAPSSPLVELLPPTTLTAASTTSGAPADATAVRSTGTHVPDDVGTRATGEAPPALHSAAQPAAADQPQPQPQAAPAVQQQAQERYLITSLPSLVLRGRLPHAAEPEFKGDLVVHSPDTGMVVSITFGDEGAVKGVVERQPPPQPATAAGSSSAQQQAGGGTPAGRRQQPLHRLTGVIGTVVGSLHDSIHVACPALGLEGDIHSEQPPAPGLPPLAPALDLAAPGPQQLPRLWSALHDALLYADPAQASGGKAAEQMTHQLAGILHSLFPGSSGSSSNQSGGGAGGSGSAAGGPAATARSARGGRTGRSAAGAAGKGSVAGGSSSANVAASAAAAAAYDDSDADSDFEAAAARDAGDTAEDPRDVPPSYKVRPSRQLPPGDPPPRIAFVTWQHGSGPTCHILSRVPTLVAGLKG
ncbi:hypothetical protein HXX76_006562 [Chlamydomonas incerta]|uniref:Uncharacterized protein n=1 Tax=Chlamydomonas incerta TaxID=51695 RepID=A0A835TDJ4_CHLIN|nr:hypothetical protein HXX76_006562 [Chlamydomonas incerta]|eukprot:KAG2436251.1 hypothetical protein HXX76_006562 [Chlamydomonas incerta]